MNVRLSQYISSTNVNSLVEELKNRVDKGFNSRNAIDKRDWRDELSKVESVPFILSKLAELRKVDNRYEVIIGINHRGNVVFSMAFPITEFQLDEVIKTYTDKRKEYGCCVRKVEVFYDVLHNYVENLFPWVDMEMAKSYQSYAMWEDNNLIREFEFMRIKRY